MRWRSHLTWWALGCLLACGPRPLERSRLTAVVVELAKPGRAAARAGILPGDRLLRWSRAASSAANTRGAAGPIDSLFELNRVEMEEAPRGAITLHGEHLGEARSWQLPAERWDLHILPELNGTSQASYQEGLKLFAAKAVVDGANRWRDEARRALEAGEPQLAGWWRLRLARALVEAGDTAAAAAEVGTAITALDAERDAVALFYLLERQAMLEERLGHWPQAKVLLDRGLTLAEQRERDGLLAGAYLSRLALWAGQQEKNLEAKSYLEKALPIFEREAPGSAELGMIVNRLGIIARRREDFDAALSYFERCIATYRQLGPDTIAEALCEMNRAHAMNNLGDLDAARSSFRRAVELLEKLAPGSAEHGLVLESYAGSVQLMGDLSEAETILLQALDLYRALPSVDPEIVASVLVKLGILAQDRQDDAAAEHWLGRAHEQLVAGGHPSDELSSVQEGLSVAAKRQGDFVAARRWQQLAVETEEQIDPGSIDAAEKRANRAALELEAPRGNRAGAARELERELSFVVNKAPQSREAGLVEALLGEALLSLDRPAAAAEHLERATTLLTRLTPDTLRLAEVLHLQGRALLASGRAESGRQLFCRAVDVLDRQRLRLGGSAEARASFEAKVANLYHACQEAEVEEGRPEAAFGVLERGRARLFLSLLEQRRLQPADGPAELWREHTRLETEQQRARAALAASQVEGPARENAAAQLAAAQERLRAWETTARAVAPRAMALRQPLPFDLAQTRASLEPGTVLLAYSVGAQKTLLFVVENAAAGTQGFSVASLPMGHRELAARVTALRQGLEVPAGALSLDRRRRELGQLLLAPAAAALGRAERVLISPNGPLHALPFAALLWNGQPLVRVAPLHTVISATVYGEILAARARTPPAGALLAFGDPLYTDASPPATNPATGGDLLALRPGRAGLAPLPRSRDEVQAIATLFSGARVFLGAEATEGRVLAEAPTARRLHFACHGLLDERLPLHSALVLTVPSPSPGSNDDGVLAAWEIFEHLRLDADLVTLSACESGLGQEMGGEGLLSLTRAFQYAGARSVLSSLWKVADQPTSELMRRFYGFLAAGQPTAEALRAAQLELLSSRDSELSRPRHWAAFQLSGDWR